MGLYDLKQPSSPLAQRVRGNIAMLKFLWIAVEKIFCGRTGSLQIRQDMLKIKVNLVAYCLHAPELFVRHNLYTTPSGESPNRAKFQYTTSPHNPFLKGRLLAYIELPR